MINISAGDWVQATQNFSPDEGQHIVSNDVGHVLEAIDAEWVNVFFERTGVVTVCHVEELVRLCDYNGAVSAPTTSDRS